MHSVSVVRTGVELTHAGSAAENTTDRAYRRELAEKERTGQVVVVQSKVLIDLVIDGEAQRWDYPDHVTPVELDRDPTNQLMEMVDFERTNLLNLWADLAHGGTYDVTRWEFYGAPFHIELDSELAQRLTDAWEPAASHRQD
jgi:hypothetical protein